MVGLFKQPKRHLKKLVRDGEYVDAIVFGKNLEPEYSDDSDFMFIMGSIYFIVDDAKKALPYFEKSFQLNSEVSFKNKLFPPSDFCTLKPVS